MNGTDCGAMLEQALAAGRARDYPRAVEILTRIVGSTTTCPQALLYLGRAYHAMGDPARAAQTLAFYVRQHPQSVPGHFFLGRAYIALEEYPLAVRHLKKAVEVNPSFSAAYGLLGMACLKARRPDKAIWWFARALEIDPQNKRLQVGYLNTALVLAIRLFYRGELADAARLFTEVLEQRRASIVPHLYLASIYREMGRPDLALFHMDAATAISPDDPLLHLQKAVIHLAQGQRAEAASEVRVGTRLLSSSVAPAAGSPEEILRFITVNLYQQQRYRECVFYGVKLLRESYDDSPMHALVAEAYRNLGDLQKAKNHYLRAIEKDKASIEPHYGLMSVLWERNEYEELLSESARFVQKNRSDPMGRYFYSLALSRTGAAIEQVLTELQQQVKARGPDPVLMAELAAVYVRAGLPELAEGWYERSMKLSSPSGEMLLAVADLYENLGKKKGMRKAFEKYLEVSPDDRGVRRRLVHALLDQEDFTAAAEHIAKLLPVEPGNARLKATLAVCYRRTGRFAEALVLLRDLLEQSPGSEEHIKAAVYCLDRMGSRPTAVRALEGFMKQHGEALSLLLMLGVLHYQAGSLEKASETFRRAVSLSPSDWRSNRNLGMVYRKMGNEEFAEKFLARAAQYREASQEEEASPRK